ncbi:DUF4351 domain-containing protein [Leptolyngbya sp. NK1-12]|uniref:DUF4351 domain-containing protein n=1 Tax=Leptolyngbya sp. NK1-12 TaxID=2547451 RepID=A0AA96WC56_9CYAN|nr:DUF4351 domain-containing protein [Leptolyngbya sp. NK1-12]
MASAYVLAGLRFEEAVIRQIIRRDVMRQFVTYQAILQEDLSEALLDFSSLDDLQAWLAEQEQR